jgi:hypothetical protein
MSVSEEREWTISLGVTDADGDELRVRLRYAAGGTDVYVSEVTPLGMGGFEAAIPADEFLEVVAAIEGMARRTMLDGIRDSRTRRSDR